MGTREVPNTNNLPIGGNGGSAGPIEWVNLDGQTLVLNNTWQQFSFDMDAAPITAFTGNGVLDGIWGTLEHIRFRSDGIVGPYEIWIDDVADTVAGLGTVNFGTFEGYASGQEVMFQEPRFSGSTSGHLALSPNTAGVDNTVAHSGSGSYKIAFQFLDGDLSRWLRLTSFSAGGQPQPNPLIRYDQDSVVSFWLKGTAVPEPGSLSVLSLGVLALIRGLRKPK